MKVAIFGLGFVGKQLSEKLLDEFEVYTYSRSSQIENSVIFDVTKNEDIKKITHKFDASIITFPIVEATFDFLPKLFEISKHNILLGSTRIYLRYSEGQIITEQTELDTNNNRYLSEQEFLKLGGTIVRLCGIYGKSRNPLNWLSSPRISYSNKQLNLIHLDDIVTALQKMLTQKPQTQVYNLSDGAMHSWKDIIDYASAQGLLPAINKSEQDAAGNAFICNKKFCAEYPGFEFQDLFAFLSDVPF